VDRFTAAFLSERIGAVFRGRVTGVTRFGLFVKLDETGADGLVPISTLPADFYDHDADRHTLVGRRWGRSFQLGEAAWVRLVEAERATGGLLLQLVEGEEIEAQPSGWEPDAVPIEPTRRRKQPAETTSRRGEAKPKGRGRRAARQPARRRRGR
jgi:ribonuclease R